MSGGTLDGSGNTVLSLCDRVLIMDKGAVIADTTPDKLKSK